MRSPILKGLAIIASLLVSSWIASTALSLMNNPSDIAVGAGITILLLILAGWATFLMKCFKNFIKKTPGGNSGITPTLFVLVLIPMLFSGCGCTRVGPGYVGVKINMTGDNRGVNEIPLTTGWVFYNLFTQKVFEYPTFVQTAVWTRDIEEGSPINEEVSFNSKEGMVVTGDISFSYSLERDKVPAFYVKFRNDDLNVFTHGFLKNIARDIFNEIGGKYPIEDIYGPRKEEFLADVRAKIRDQVTDIGVKMEQFGFIGAPRPPQNVIDALNLKVAATQNAMRAENELRETTANAQKAIAKAQGEAESNRVLTQSITPQLIQWRQLQIAEQTIAKWDGRRPMVEGSGSGLLLQIPVSQQQPVLQAPQK
jgi:regulator of protease activity HflC (stomatin/prohibitin superfamily)